MAVIIGTDYRKNIHLSQQAGKIQRYIPGAADAILLFIQ